MAIRALHTLVLAAFALAQPLLDLLSRNVEFLLAHGLDRLDLLLLALVLTAGIPGAIALAKWALESALESVLGPRSGLLHRVTVALLVTVILLPVGVRAVGRVVPGWLLVAVAAALGVAATVAYARWAKLRRFVTVASVALLVFPIHFLFISPVREVLNPPTVADRPADLGSESSVVVLVFDGLPLSTLVDESGAIDRHRFPHFAALADEAHFFRNATTVAETTAFAIPAIVSGLYPVWDRPPTSAMYPQNLFTLFAETHDLNVFEPLTRLCPRELCVAGPARVSRGERLAGVFSDLRLIYSHAVLPADLTRKLPGVSATWRDFANRAPGDSRAWVGLLRSRRSDMRWVFSEFLARIVDGGRPSLHFLHANVPHGPYKYLPSGVEYATAAIHPNTRKHGGDPLDVDWAETQALQRHLLQVGYADTMLGALRARLEREGLTDQTLLIVTADHGMSFKPGVWSRELDRELRNAGDLLLVPLLIKLPGQHEGRESDRNVETIDILPTLMHVLGGHLPDPVDGRALFDPTVTPREQKVVYRKNRESPIGGRRTRVVLPPDIPHRNDTVKRIGDLFGRGADGDLFDVGPHRELVGRSVSALRVESESPFVAHLKGRSDYDDIDTASGWIPALVRGTVTGAGLPAALDLAVAVNGVIRAVTRSFEPTAESVRFVAMVPEQAFRDGPNLVEVFVVRDDSIGSIGSIGSMDSTGSTGLTGLTGLSILPTSVRPAVTYAVAKAHDGTLAVVVSSEGRLFPVVRNAVRGQVIRRGEAFTGGAFDVRRSRVAEVVVMFEAGRFRLAHPLGPGRSKIRELETTHPGQIAVPQFQLSVPDLAPDERGDARIRFVGLSEDAASELGYRTHFRLLGAWPGHSVELAIEERDGNEGIAVSSGGAWIPLAVGGVRGRFEVAAADGGGIEVSGWAVDETRRSVPPAALVFVDGRFVGTVAIARRRSDVAAQLGSSDFQDCGFETTVPTEGPGGSATAAVRVFVPMPSGSAAELGGP